MNKTLVLFTSSYPYQYGEQFLETEIKYLSKVFTRIIIVPMKSHKNSRSVPDNVEVDNFIVNSKKRYLYKIKSFISKYFVKYASFNSKVIKFLFKNMVYIENYKKWIELFLQKNNVEDCLFYTYWFVASTSALSLVKNKIVSLKFITRVHGSDLYENIHGLIKFPDRQQVVSNINMIFTVSETGKNHLLKKYDISTAKIQVSRLGVKENNSLSKLSQDGKLRIVSCSNLVPIKRVDFIIEALGLLKSKGIEIIWTHIGDGRLRAKLEKQAEKRLGDNIHHNFLGVLKNPEVLRFYQTNPVDVFINTSSSEGIPVSIMEAQSFGIPVIATDVGGIKEIVDNKNGYLLPSNSSAQEIADAIFEVANKKEEWKNKRINSFENWKKKYNAEKNYKDFMNDLIKLL